MELTQAAFDYSIRIAEIVKHLRLDDKCFPLCDELLRCGVEAGLFLRDPPNAKKAVDCLKRADYLLEMATTAGYLTARQTEKIRESGQDLEKTAREGAKQKGGNPK